MHVHHLIVSFFNITMCCSIVWTQMLFYNRVQIKKTIKKTPHHHAHARIGEVTFLYCIFCDLDKSSCITTNEDLINLLTEFNLKVKIAVTLSQNSNYRKFATILCQRLFQVFICVLLLQMISTVFEKTFHHSCFALSALLCHLNIVFIVNSLDRKNTNFIV